MYYTSVADADLNSSEADLDRYKSVPDKELRNSKRGAFLLITLLVLMVAFTVWVRVRPDMSTYDGMVVLVIFQIVGFLFVLTMLAFVLLRVNNLIDQISELDDMITNIAMNTLPKLDTPDDDICSGD